MLDAVDDRRPVGTFKNIHDPFESQEIGAAMLGKRLKQQRQRHGADRLLSDDRMGIDVMRAVPVSLRWRCRSKP